MPVRDAAPGDPGLNGVHRLGSVEHACSSGRDALRAGRQSDAMRWLDRAWRLSPGDGRIGTLLASVLIECDQDRAIEILRELADAQGDVRAAQVGLVAACWRGGRREEAAAALCALLRRCTPPRGRAFRKLARLVAEGVGAPGWVGVDETGRMTVALVQPGTVVWRIDGRTTQMRQRRAVADYALDCWHHARVLEAGSAERALLGSPMEMPAFRQAVVRGSADRAPAGGRPAAMRRWREDARGASVLLVTHAHGGGTERYVAQRCDELRGRGVRPIVLRLSGAEGQPERCRCAVSNGPSASAAMVFDLPAELASLATMLAGDRPEALELHHLGGFPPHVLALCRRLRIPYDLHVHDYALVCPRVTFLGAGDRYCGEPAETAQCERCVAEHGVRVHEAVPVAALRARSATLLAGAAAVHVACRDVSRRMQRHFPGVSTTMTQWEPPIAPAEPRYASGEDGQTLVCVVGAIGRDKGFDVLLGCAADAARRALPLRFVVVGHTIDDDALLATGRAFVTGPFREHEAEALVRAQAAGLGFVASVCPETWSYALSTLWRAGLDVAAFAIGAPAERIRDAGRGWLIPLGAPPSCINQMLLSTAQGANAGASAPVPVPVQGLAA